MKKSGLGKGLDNLISKKTVDNVSRETLVRVSEIEPYSDQPRKNFDDEKLEELAASIKEHGIIQPITVVKKDGYYRIVVGERRWRAAKIAGVQKIPVIIKEYDDKQIDVVALIENIQREGLNPIEEAVGIKRLMEEYGLKQDEVANILSKSRPYISNSMRLLKLSKDIQALIIEDKLSVGHARIILQIDPERREKVVEKIIKEGLSVRETEKLIDERERPLRKKVQKDITISRLEQMLEERFSTRIEIKNNNKNKGKIQITYSNLDEMERIIDLLKGAK